MPRHTDVGDSHAFTRPGTRKLLGFQWILAGRHQSFFFSGVENQIEILDWAFRYVVLLLRAATLIVCLKDKNVLNPFMFLRAWRPRDDKHLLQLIKGNK